jgi:hypothetical protein
VADIRHLLADIGRFLFGKICFEGGNILVFQDFREQMKFGTVVALAVYSQGFVKLRWRISYERQAEGTISSCFTLTVHHFLNR